jgi:hypothetical protein
VWSTFIGLLTALLLSTSALAQAPAAGGAPTPLSAEQLTGLVGRIALYPDDLVAIILPAATSPLQVVQADRFLEKRKSDPNLKVDDKWDDPVKSLCNYPDVVKMMSSDLDWTSELGEAVVEDQQAVLEAVQIFRRQAQAAGSLKSDAKQVVKTEKEIIIIAPADPQVIYVPQYNPTTVVVQSAPPVYYPTAYPSYYYPYPPGAALATGVIWGAALGAAWSGNRYGYEGGDINVNKNTNVSRGGNTVNQGGGRQGGSGSGSSQWKSNKQPGQVSSSVGKSPSSSRAGDARGGSSSGRSGASASAGGAGGQGSAGAGGKGAGGAGASAGGTGGKGSAGAGSKGAGAGAGPSSQPAGGGKGGDSAMGGYGSGRQTSADSSRGASSRSSASGGGGGASRSTASSGGASRGGGGGGGGGRGGGGRR